MVTLLAGLLGAVFLGSVMAVFGLDGWLWTPVFAIAGFIGATLPVNLLVKKRLEAIFSGIQNDIQSSQEIVRRKAMAMQNKMMSSTKSLQSQLEKQQEAAIVKAIASLEAAEPLKKWNFLVAKQIDTLKAQLYFQIKNFSKADVYFANSLSLDPVTVAMKLTRFYKRGEMEAFDKLYAKSSRRFKGEKSTILHALRSWVLVREKRIDDAIHVLDKARKDTESSVLQKNWEHLVNGRERNFSNAGIGDIWYALHLETPKPARVKQRRNARF